MSNNNKITKSKINKALKEQNKQKQVYFTINGDTNNVVTYDLKFSPKKVGKLCDELLVYMIYNNKHHLENFNYVGIIDSLIVKHFTDLKIYKTTSKKYIELEETEVKELLEDLILVTSSLMGVRLDNSYDSMFVFLMELFDEFEVNYVYDSVVKLTETLNDFDDVLGESMDIISDLQSYANKQKDNVEENNESSQI